MQMGRRQCYSWWKEADKTRFLDVRGACDSEKKESHHLFRDRRLPLLDSWVLILKDCLNPTIVNSFILASTW